VKVGKFSKLLSLPYFFMNNKSQLN